MAMENLQNLRMGDVFKAAVGKHRANCFAVCAGAALKRMDYSERRFAFAQIRGNRLAEHIFGCGEVEDVIDNLECETEIASILAELAFDDAGRVRNGCAKLRGDLKEAGSLAEDQVEVLF